MAKAAAIPSRADDRSFVSLAAIVRVRGRIGEVAATILTDIPQRLTTLRDVLLLDSAGRRRGARVRRCWLSSSRGGQAIFHFEGIDSISDAQQLVGCEVQVPLAERAPVPAGKYYVTDLVGCEVWEVMEVMEVVEDREKDNQLGTHSSRTSKTSTTSSTSILGHVRDVYFESGTPLLAVTAASGGELLIPLAEEICTRIDPAARRIEVRLPPGLRDLNP
ncbi:MAG: ribosome maturation factor RimM [Candidatus Acidiferrales bacterium]